MLQAGEQESEVRSQESEKGTSLILVFGNRQDDIHLFGSHQENNCVRFFWAMTDANYNALGLVDRFGTLVERYEYTPTEENAKTTGRL